MPGGDSTAEIKGELGGCTLVLLLVKSKGECCHLGNKRGEGHSKYKCWPALGGS